MLFQSSRLVAGLPHAYDPYNITHPQADQEAKTRVNPAFHNTTTRHLHLNDTVEQNLVVVLFSKYFEPDGRNSHVCERGSPIWTLSY